MKDETADLTFFTWGVPARGYVWKHSARTVPHLGGTGAAPFLLPDPKTTKSEPSAPLDEPPSEQTPLFQEFANLSPDPASILEFAKRRGWLGIGEPVVMPSRRRKKGADVQQGESLVRWQREILSMRHAITCWRDIEDEHVERLQQRIRPNGEDCIVWEERILCKDLASSSWPVADPPPDRHDRSREHRSARLQDRFMAKWQQLSERAREEFGEGREKGVPPTWVRCLYRRHHPYLFDKDLCPWNVMVAAKALLADLVNEQLRGTVSACLLLDRKRHLTQYIRPRHLLAAMWVQFAQVVHGQRRIIFCKHCHQPFEVTERRRSKRAHTQCVNRAKVYRLRWKERVHALTHALSVKNLSREKRQELQRRKAAFEAKLKAGKRS